MLQLGSSRFAIYALSLAAAGCTGMIGDASKDRVSHEPAPQDTSSPSPGAPRDPGDRVTNVGDIAGECKPGAAPSVDFTPLRRLNQLEYANSLRDLLGVQGLADGFVADSRVGTFHSNVDTAISELQADQYRLAAESAAAKVLSNVGAVVGCDPTTGEACASTFIRDFGLKAFRRPLTTEEQASYLEVYRAGTARGAFAGGIGLVVRAMLQSPYFLYLVERTPVGSGVAKQLGPYEMASRLSYLLWASMPDAQLLTAADKGELATADQLRAQAERMLADPRSKDTLGQFQLEWLQLDGIDNLEKDTTLFPTFNDALKQAMRDEVGDFLDTVVQSASGSYTDLLTAPYAMLNGPLFSLYGVKAPAAGTGFTRVDFTGGVRAGILTQPAFLATHGHQNQGSPVKRGVVVRQAVLCQDLPPPPANVNNAPPALSPNLTTRQRFAAHDASPACKGCHGLIDGIGFGFERYDAIGAYRASENGNPIDDTGNLIQATPDVEGPFSGPVGLGQKLAASELARSCFVTQWFRFAFKRQPQTTDACTASAMMSKFTSSHQSVRELVLSAVASDAFRYGVGEP
jgi:hypothetical protein